MKALTHRFQFWPTLSIAATTTADTDLTTADPSTPPPATGLYRGQRYALRQRVVSGSDRPELRYRGSRYSR